MKQRRLRTQQGFAIVENLLAVAIVAIGSYFILTSASVFKQMSTTVETESAEDKQVLQIIENIRSSPESYQIAFIDSEQRDLVLGVDKLPMAWSNQVVATAETCPECPGRFGFMMQPFSGMRGLYIVTLRMTHKSWIESYKDFEFVVSPR